MWEDSRGVVRGSAEEARRHAFSDDAKERVDEHHHVIKAPRARSRGGVLVAAGVAGLLLVGGGVYAATRGDAPAAEAQPDGNGTPSPSPAGTESSAPPEEPTPADTTPTGVFAVTHEVLRRIPANSKGDPVGTTVTSRWRVTPTRCDENQCTGRVKSSSGAVYRYTWDGAELTLQRAQDQAVLTCEDDAGQPIPASTADALYDYEVDQPQVTSEAGAIDRIEFTYWRRLTLSNFVGLCAPTPRDERAVQARVVAQAVSQ